jgi:hypothetical protein
MYFFLVAAERILRNNFKKILKEYSLFYDFIINNGIISNGNAIKLLEEIKRHDDVSYGS